MKHSQKFQIIRINTKTGHIAYCNFTLRKLPNESNKNFIKYIKEDYIPNEVVKNHTSFLVLEHHIVKFSKLLKSGEVI